MDFEDILQDVGGFGVYQKFLVIVFLIPAFVVIPWFFMNMMFMSNTPEHWCYVPEIASSGLTLEMQKFLIRPPQDPSCLTYDVNFSEILRSGDNLEVNTSWPTKYCTDGWQYDTTYYDATAVTRWNLVCNDGHYSSLVLSMLFFGNLCGAPFYSFLSDKVGRKPMFFGLATLVALTEIGSALSPNFVLFLVLRALNGSAFATIYASGYIILLEVVNPNIRTGMNGVARTSWTVGLCLLPLIAKLTRNWVYLSVLTSSVAASLLLYCRLLPESPRWLISRGRYTEAHSIMTKISKINGRTDCQGNQLMQKIEALGERIKKQKAAGETDSPLDLLKYPTLRKRFLLVTICRMGNSIPYFGLQLNVKNLAGSEFLNFFLVALVEIPSQLVGWVFMERIGRRWCSVLAFIITTAACFMPVVFPPENATVDIIASLLAKSSTSIAFLTVLQQCPELMPTSLRGVGMGLSSTIGTGSALLVPYIVYLAKFGTYMPFLVFSAISFIAGICATFLPETLNKNLPQTVADAENFEKDFKFFSCSRNNESDAETAQSSWRPIRLSAADLSSSIKNVVVEESCKNVQVLLQRNSMPSGHDVESTVHL